MATCTVTGTLETPALKGRGGVKINFVLLQSFGATSGAYIAGTEARTVTDQAGDFDIDIAVPDSGSVGYRVYVNNEREAVGDAYLSAADSPVDFEDILAGLFEDVESQSVATLIYANQAAATVGADGQYATLAAALTAGEKHIALLPATYTGAVSITQDDVRITGYGATWTELTTGSTFAVSGARVRLEGLAFSGSHDGTEGSMTAHSAIYTTGQWTAVHRCKFTNLKGYAVQASGADDLEISYCKAYNVATAASPVKYARYCFYVPGGTLRANVHHNYVTGWSQAIGFWYGTSYSTAGDNALVDNLGHESGPTRRSACEDYGDSVQNIANRWLNNKVDGSTGQCIELAQGLKGTLVQGNVLMGAGTGYTTSASPIFVTGGDGGAGGETSDHIRIIDNDLYGANDNTVSDGCGISGGIDDILWENNRFYEFLNTTATLHIQGNGATAVKVRDNVFRDCGGGGQAVIRLSVAECAVSDNDIVSTIAGTRGIFAEATDGHRIADNKIDVTGRALTLQSGNIVTGNEVESADNAIAVSVVGTSDLLGNRFTGDDNTSGTVVLSITGNRNRVKDNHIFRQGGGGGWGNAISCNTTDNRIEQNTLEIDGNDTLILLGAASTRNTVRNNTNIRADNTLGITDNGAGNQVERNHTLTTLGT
jgi:hypothetical protein